MRNNTSTRKDTEDKKDLYLERLVQQVLRKYNKEEAETCEAADTSKSLEGESSSTSPSLPRAPKPILKKQSKDEQSHPKCSSSSSSSSMPHHWQEIVLSFKSSSTPSLRSSHKNNKIMLPVVKALYKNPTWFDQILREYAPAFATARTPRVQAAVLQQVLSSVAQHGATLLVPHAWTQQDLLRHLTRLLRIQWANQTWSTMAAAQDVVLPANDDNDDKHRAKQANPAFWNRRIQQHAPRYAAATTPQEQEAIVQQVLNIFRGDDSSCRRLVVPPGWNEKDIAHHVHDILRQESSHQQTSTATVKHESSSSSSSTKTTATLPPRQVSPCPVDKASFKRKATSQDFVVTPPPPLPQPCYSYYPPPAPYSAATRCAAVELEPPAVPCFSSQPPVRLTPRRPTTITTTTCRGPYSDLMRKNAVQQPKKKRKTQSVAQPTTTVPATTQPVVVPFCRRPHPHYWPTTPTSTPCYSHTAPLAATSTTGSVVPTHPDACTSK